MKRHDLRDLSNLKVVDLRWASCECYKLSGLVHVNPLECSSDVG